MADLVHWSLVPRDTWPTQPFLLPAHSPHLHSRIPRGAREKKNCPYLAVKGVKGRDCWDARMKVLRKKLCWERSYPIHGRRGQFQECRAPGSVPRTPSGGGAACQREARDQGGGSTPPKQHSPFVLEYVSGHLVLYLCVWMMSLVAGD